MDGVPFTQSQPPKDWNETVAMTKSQILKGTQVVGAQLNVFGSQLKEQTSTASVVLSEKTANLK